MSQPDDVSNRATRWTSKNATDAAENRNADVMRCWSEPSSVQNTNNVSAGTSDSTGDQRRNAAQSARNTAKKIASAAAITKPVWTGTGALNSWNAFHASLTAAVNALHVLASGMPAVVVDANHSQLDNTTKPANEMTALVAMPTPRRRRIIVTRCE